MKEHDLRKEFIRIDRVSETRTDVLVQVISWPSPHTSVSDWEIWRRVDGNVAKTEFETLCAQLLDDPKYFGMCVECGERNPSGWMHSKQVCQGCAQQNHGVVY